MRVRGEVSEWAPVTSGIPQGSVLGPTLFIIFINDLPADLSCEVQLFADDAKVYSSAGDREGQCNLQEDLNKLRAWSEKWLLPFNTAKCSTLHLGATNTRHIYYMGVHELAQSSFEQDLGVFVDEELKFRKHASVAVLKANKILGAINRSFLHLDDHTLPLLYKSLVRPHIEYANIVWGPFNKADQVLVERVQRRATRMVPSLRALDYGQRLRKLNLPSLWYRRLRGDMLFMYKLTHGLLGISKNEFFLEPTVVSTRGHRFKVGKPRAVSRARRHHFAVRTVSEWNKLPAWVAESISCNRFKNNINNHWGELMFSFPT